MLDKRKDHKSIIYFYFKEAKKGEQMKFNLKRKEKLRAEINEIENKQLLEMKIKVL
jgi:hypothetical protein